MEKTTRRELGHQGFSLLEIILALSIFSISALVLAKGFQSAATLNFKSAKIQEASLTAQNVMEEIKANSLEQLALQFNYPYDQEGNSRFDVMNQLDYSGIKELDQDGNPVVLYEKSGAFDNLSKVTSSIISKDSGETWQFQEKEEGLYYFSMENIQGENNSFDARITLDASEYHNNSRTGINDQPVPSIADLNVYEDAFFVQEEKVNAKAEEYYKRQYQSFQSGGEISSEEIWNHLYRTIDLEVTKSGGMQKVTADYQYQFDDPAMIGCTSQEHIEGSCDCFFDDPYIIYDNSESDGTLRSVYLFYWPNYNSTNSSQMRDRISFSNRTNMELDFYLIKQNNEENNLSVKEHNYKMELELIEEPSQTDWTTNLAKFHSALKIRTNLDENLGAEDSFGSRRQENQTSLIYTDKGSNPEKQRQGSAVKTVTDWNGLAANEAKDRLFTVKVEIFDSGAAPNGYEGEKPLVELEGAKEK